MMSGITWPSPLERKDAATRPITTPSRQRSMFGRLADRSRVAAIAGQPHTSARHRSRTTAVPQSESGHVGEPLLHVGVEHVDHDEVADAGTRCLIR